MNESHIRAISDAITCGFVLGIAAALAGNYAVAGPPSAVEGLTWLGHATLIATIVVLAVVALPLAICERHFGDIGGDE